MEEATQPTQTDLQKCEIRKLMHTKMNAMESLLILILVILLCFDVPMPTWIQIPLYKCIFYLSDGNLRKFEAYGLWKIIDKENTSLSLIAHAIEFVLSTTSSSSSVCCFSFAFRLQCKKNSLYIKCYWSNEIYVNYYCCAYLNFIRLGETIYMYMQCNTTASHTLSIKMCRWAIFLNFYLYVFVIVFFFHFSSSCALQIATFLYAQNVLHFCIFFFSVKSNKAMNIEHTRANLMKWL